MNGNDVQHILGSALKEVRVFRGLTQEKLAELVGVQTNTINRIETGVNFVTSNTLAKLSTVLNVHPSILLSERPSIVQKEHIDYLKQINYILQVFSPDKLREVYNILCVMNK